jgi:hypothetical protein
MRWFWDAVLEYVQRIEGLPDWSRSVPMKHSAPLVGLFFCRSFIMRIRFMRAAMLVFSSCAAMSAANAAPSVSGVSGTLDAGEIVTLSGSGFGTKANAKPVVWDDFEKGSTDKLIAGSAAEVGSWDTGSGSDAVFYSAAKAYAGSKSARHDFVTNYNASLAKNFTVSHLYMDFYILTDYVDVMSRNWKIWRFYGDNDQLQMAYVFQCGGQLLTQDQSNQGWSIGNWGGSSYSKNTWMHVQLTFNASSPGAADGTVKHFINSTAYGLNSSAVMTRKSSANFDQIRIGHYWAQDAVDACAGNKGAQVYTDNVYIDTSWARVELGDQSTYAASKHREIQIPQTWSSGQVTVQVNPGSFKSGSTAYLYVIDENENISPGVKVTIGQSGGTPPATTVPSAPTAVSAK